jgi:hypothetical protein
LSADGESPEQVLQEVQAAAGKLQAAGN